MPYYKAIQREIHADGGRKKLAAAILYQAIHDAQLFIAGMNRPKAVYDSRRGHLRKYVVNHYYLSVVNAIQLLHFFDSEECNMCLEAAGVSFPSFRNKLIELKRQLAKKLREIRNESN